jgi:hypothetical protein
MYLLSIKTSVSILTNFIVSLVKLLHLTTTTDTRISLYIVIQILVCMLTMT